MICTLPLTGHGFLWDIVAECSNFRNLSTLESSRQEGLPNGGKGRISPLSSKGIGELMKEADLAF